MASENSCYIVTCPVNLLLEKVVKRNVTKKCVLFLSYMYTYIYIYIYIYIYMITKDCAELKIVQYIMELKVFPL